MSLAQRCLVADAIMRLAISTGESGRVLGSAVELFFFAVPLGDAAEDAQVDTPFASGVVRIGPPDPGWGTSRAALKSTSTASGPRACQ